MERKLAAAVVCGGHKALVRQDNGLAAGSGAGGEEKDPAAVSLIPPGQSLREIRLQFKQQILVLSKEGIDVRLPDLLPQKLVGGALIQKDRLYMGDGGAEDRDDAVERSVTENADACLSGLRALWAFPP